MKNNILKWSLANEYYVDDTINTVRDVDKNKLYVGDKVKVIVPLIFSGSNSNIFIIRGFSSKRKDDNDCILILEQLSRRFTISSEDKSAMLRLGDTNDDVQRYEDKQNMAQCMNYESRKYSKTCNLISAVYVIRQLNTNYVKIGYAQDVYARLKELQVASPEKLLLVGWLKNSFDKPTHILKFQEEEEHKRISKYKVRGEWFKLSKELLEELKERYHLISEIGV